MNWKKRKIVTWSIMGLVVNWSWLITAAEQLRDVDGQGIAGDKMVSQDSCTSPSFETE